MIVSLPETGISMVTFGSLIFKLKKMGNLDLQSFKPQSALPPQKEYMGEKIFSKEEVEGI